MFEDQRIKGIAASLSFSPLPQDAIDWMHEPSLRLLTEDEAEHLVPILQELGQHSERGVPIFWELSQLRPDKLELLETFVAKSQQGMKRLKSQHYVSVFEMNHLNSPTV